MIKQKKVFFLFLLFVIFFSNKFILICTKSNGQARVHFDKNSYKYLCCLSSVMAHIRTLVFKLENPSIDKGALKKEIVSLGRYGAG
jgi:hypothetical protein